MSPCCFLRCESLARKIIYATGRTTVSAGKRLSPSAVCCTVVILVLVVEIILAQIVEGDAACCDLGENLILIDRVRVIEMDHFRLLPVVHLFAPLD